MVCSNARISNCSKQVERIYPIVISLVLTLVATNFNIPLSLSDSVFNPSYSQVSSTISGNSGSPTAPKRGSGRRD